MAATLEAAPPDATSPDEEPRTHRGRIRPVEHRPMPADAALSWVITIVITAVAGVVRLWGIGFPGAKQFDEVYYATEGGEILHNGGYENNPGYMFIVHPPFGKWLVAAGITVFGDNSVGWRVPAAIAGTLCVAILVRVTRRMTRSTLLGAVAGILLAADGLSIVQSRFALLDIFLAVFVLAGFACLVVDRDRVRDRLAAVSPYGDRLGASLLPSRSADRNERNVGEHRRDDVLDHLTAVIDLADHVIAVMLLESAPDAHPPPIRTHMARQIIENVAEAVCAVSDHDDSGVVTLLVGSRRRIDRNTHRMHFRHHVWVHSGRLDHETGPKCALNVV